MKKLFCLLLCLTVLAGCSSAPAPAEANIFAMDTYMSFAAYGEGADEALVEAVHLVQALEKELSRTDEQSAVYAINHGTLTTLSAHTGAVLDAALRWSADTEGLFDVTVAPLVALWDIMGDSPHVADDNEIAALLPLVGAEHVHIADNTVTLDAGCAIDLGGIGKGYAGDMVAALLREKGLTGATASLGGNVVVIGAKPDGSLWNVAVRDPHADGYACLLTLTDCAVVTSGGYQRYFTADDGTVYQHILDPRTGRPAESDLVSVSIVCADGTRADAYSTALYIMGRADAVAFWRSRQDFDMVLITADGRLLYTPGLADRITFPEGAVYEAERIN